MPMLKETMLKRLLLPMVAAGGGGSAPVQDTATGNPLVFFTDLARPLKSLLIPFTPIQQGTGDPSPENIRPIVPWEGLTVWGAGKNLFDKTKAVLDKYIGGQGQLFPSEYNQAVTDYIPVKEGEKIISNAGLTISYGSAFYSDKSESAFISYDNGGHLPFTIPNGAKYIRLTFPKAYIDTYQVEVGTTATAYEPYKPITETDISFASPVYGGTLDAVTGVLTVNRALFDLGSINWDKTNRSGFSFYYKNSALTMAKKYGNGELSTFVCSEYKTSKGADIYSGSSGNYSISMLDSTPPGIRIRNDDCSTPEEMKEALNGIMLVYELATPQEIQLTPQQITALVGNNTIWSDADGSMTAIYLKKG